MLVSVPSRTAAGPGWVTRVQGLSRGSSLPSLRDRVLGSGRVSLGGHVRSSESDPAWTRYVRSGLMQSDCPQSLEQALAAVGKQAAF